MSVVKINAITIPEGMGPQLEGRFAGRAKMVEAFEGFEDFQLLRPTPNQESGEDRYFVYTRWASEENFQAWMDSQDFSKGHATGQAGCAGRRPHVLHRCRTRGQRGVIAESMGQRTPNSY